MQKQLDASPRRLLPKEKRNYLDVANSAERLVARRRIVMAIAVSRWSFPLVPAEEVTADWSSNSSNKAKNTAMLSESRTRVPTL